MRQIGREIGVRYVLVGSVMRAGAIVQVNAQLVDTISGFNLWADRFVHKTASLLDLQDTVIARIAFSLNDEVMQGGVPHEVGTLAADGNPVDERLRAMSELTGIPTPEKSLEARHHAEAGLRADPESARLWALLANVLIWDFLNAWNGAGMAEVDRAEHAADKAISLDPDCGGRPLCPRLRPPGSGRPRRCTRAPSRRQSGWIPTLPELTPNSPMSWSSSEAPTKRSPWRKRRLNSAPRTPRSGCSVGSKVALISRSVIIPTRSNGWLSQSVCDRTSGLVRRG